MSRVFIAHFRRAFVVAISTAKNWWQAVHPLCQSPSLMRPGRGSSRTFSSRAEEAGRVVVRVNPAYTSQTCSACGHRQEMPLSVRVYECPNCGLVRDRDHNSSVNILAEAV